jgi:hypothetical protein
MRKPGGKSSAGFFRKSVIFAGMKRIRVCREVHSKIIFDVFDFDRGRTYSGNWRKILLPCNGWKRISNAEFCIVEIA